MSQETVPPAPRYHFFILGLWLQPGQPDRPAAWRISLENPQTAERLGFKGLPELFAFLETWGAERAAGGTEACLSAVQIRRAVETAATAAKPASAG